MCVCANAFVRADFDEMKGFGLAENKWIAESIDGNENISNVVCWCSIIISGEQTHIQS